MKLDELTADERLEMQQHLGRLLMNLPVVSKLAGHTRPLNTVEGNYVCARPGASRAERAAVAFLADIAKRRTNEEMLARWYPEGVERAAVSATAKWGG